MFANGGVTEAGGRLRPPSRRTQQHFVHFAAVDSMVAGLQLILTHTRLHAGRLHFSSDAGRPAPLTPRGMTLGSWFEVSGTLGCYCYPGVLAL